jgi:hypothetical protein
MYRAGSPNVLPLATMRWTLVTIIVIPYQTPQAPKSVTNKRLRDDLYMSIPMRISTTPINEGVLFYPIEY